MEQEKEFTCVRCNKTISIIPGNIGTGYAYNEQREKVCYTCCAEIEKEFMRKHGRIQLFMNINDHPKKAWGYPYGIAGRVTNWAESLSFPVLQINISRHNFARVRYDGHFVFEGYYWHVFKCGDNTDICHCKKTKERAR